MFWSSVAILSYDITLNRITIEVWFRASIVLWILSASAINDSNFRKRFAVPAPNFLCVLTELEVFCLIHVFQQLLQCFTELVDLSASGSYLEEIVPCTCEIQTSRSTWRLLVVFVHLALEPLREICLGFGSPRCCIQSPASFALRFVFPR